MTGSLRKLIAIPAATAVALTIALGGLTPAQTPTPAKTQTPPAKARSKPAPAKAKAGRLDLNRASAEQMIEVLPGVGEATARKIVAGRPYKSVDDLARAGVPARTIEAIRPLVEVAAAAAPTTTAATKPATRATVPVPVPAAVPATGRVNVNTATLEQLQELPGIGPVAARAIIAGRPYRSVDDLLKVRGLGETKVAALRNRVTVASPTTATTTPTTPATTPPVTTSDPVATRKAAMTKGAATKAAAATATTPTLGGLKPGQIVNINKAPKEQLDLLPGIGPVKAQAIIEGRPFKTKEDIMKVKGIKEGEFARIKDLISVD